MRFHTFKLVLGGALLVGFALSGCGTALSYLRVPHDERRLFETYSGFMASSQQVEYLALATPAARAAYAESLGLRQRFSALSEGEPDAILAQRLMRGIRAVGTSSGSGPVQSLSTSGGRSAVSRTGPIRGVIPFISVEMLSGDDDLEGFVSPSSPSGLRRGDFPLLRKTVLGLGSPVLGDGTADFGFAVDGHGIGPTIGNILEGVTAPSSVTFSNRWGKGDNPGYIKISGGRQGSGTRSEPST